MHAALPPSMVPVGWEYPAHLLQPGTIRAGEPIQAGYSASDAARPSQPGQAQQVHSPLFPYRVQIYSNTFLYLACWISRLATQCSQHPAISTQKMDAFAKHMWHASSVAHLQCVGPQHAHFSASKQLVMYLPLQDAAAVRASAAAANVISNEQPCRVKLRIWRYSPSEDVPGTSGAMKIKAKDKAIAKQPNTGKYPLHAIAPHTSQSPVLAEGTWAAGVVQGKDREVCAVGDFCSSGMYRKALVSPNHIAKWSLALCSFSPAVRLMGQG